MAMDREEGLELFEKTRTVVIVRGVERDKILPLAEALYEGGIRMLEVTLNTVGAYYMIKDLHKHLGRKMFLGAGTVLDTSDAKAAAEAGASFFVTPNTDKRVIQYGVEENLPVYPGALTPTEVAKAWKSGATAVKLFPASTFGPGYVKELMGPYSHIPLLAVGGVHEGNAAEYLRAGCRGIGVGSAVINRQELAAGDYEALSKRAAALIGTVRATVAELEAE
ncbi:bifunctional 4-hydroxy-2-oxoglutarate aldolase/2-dehydro-3-deoxy-phosphogluconate aldolase [Gorillibacterium sp. sgz5001074]|uniref:bifunctional 4-hydroxy-2-oxoglutarate aldolase/2-dehydro-3-deoxy-phosphogluconate aldolase n=1 Tax=Gorillibacterium sp. sgz5001074 TaxID=3446695 RepID=UPI003F67DD60